MLAPLLRTIPAVGASGLAILLATVPLAKIEAANNTAKTTLNRGSLAWLSATESRTLQRVRSAIKSASRGARKVLLGKDLKTLTAQEVEQMAKERNLTLDQQDLLVEKTQHSIDQADSTFTPSLSLSLSLNRSTTRSRTAMVQRLRLIDPDWLYEEGDVIIDPETGEDTGETINSANHPLLGKVKPQSEACSRALDIGSIDGDTSFRDAACQGAIAETTDLEQASGDQSFYTHTWKAALGLFKGFSWGSSVSLSLGTNYFPYDLEQFGNGSKDMTLGLKRAQDLGESEWTSSASAKFSTPLPFTKNFGPTGFRPTVELHKSEMRQSQAKLSRDQRINAVLQQALIAYWNLVQGLLQLDTAIIHQSMLAQQRNHTQRMYKNHRATEYALMQARAEVANARNEEEIAWHNLITRANLLSEILDLPQNTVVLPSGFGKQLGRDFPLDGQKAMDTALEQHPSILAQHIDLDVKELDLRHSEHQLWPDLNMFFNYDISEINSIFGYKSFGESMAGLADPDSRNYSFGITFNYPWGNTDLEARRVQSRSSRDQSVDNFQLARMRVARNVNGALSSAYSARSQVSLAQTNLRLARAAHLSAKRQKNQGKLTEFDLLTREKDLFNARKSLIDALIGHRKSHVNLMAAGGNLVRRHGPTPTKLGDKP